MDEIYNLVMSDGRTENDEDTIPTGAREILQRRTRDLEEGLELLVQEQTQWREEKQRLENTIYALQNKCERLEQQRAVLTTRQDRTFEDSLEQLQELWKTVGTGVATQSSILENIRLASLGASKKAIENFSTMKRALQASVSELKEILENDCRALGVTASSFGIIDAVYGDSLLVQV
jgi:predicted nuclease with TOPRIM domain